MERNATMLDRDPHHAEPANLPPLPPRRTPEETADRARYYAPGRPAFITYEMRPDAVRADPTGTGDAALNAEVERRGACMRLADVCARDLIEAARRRHRTIEHKRDVLARIDALMADAEHCGPTESWTAAVLLNARLLSARDCLRRYIAQREVTP